jgi:hypothetical protein
MFTFGDHMVRPSAWPMLYSARASLPVACAHVGVRQRSTHVSSRGSQIICDKLPVVPLV